MTDIEIYNDGSLIGFHPLTPEAPAWIGDNVDSEPWQWLGPTLWVDHRMAIDLIAAMQEAGLELE